MSNISTILPCDLKRTTWIMKNVGGNENTKSKVYFQFLKN